MEVTRAEDAPMTGDSVVCPNEDCPRYISLGDLVDGHECRNCGTKMVLDIVHDAGESPDVDASPGVQPGKTGVQSGGGGE